MSIPQRPVTGVFSFDSIVEQFPDWVKDACTAFFINAMYPLQSSPGNDDLYVLLTDIAQEVRVADQGQVDRRCMPYRAEVKQHVGNLRDAFIVHNSPDLVKRRLCGLLCCLGGPCTSRSSQRRDIHDPRRRLQGAK